MANANLGFYALTVAVIVVFFAFVVGFSQSVPTANGSLQQNQQGQPAGTDGELQEISIHANSAGTYDTSFFKVKKGAPVKVNFSADNRSGCGRSLIIPQFKVSLLSKNGETQSATFVPQSDGKIEFSCPMRMFRGTIEVVS